MRVAHRSEGTRGCLSVSVPCISTVHPVCVIDNTVPRRGAVFVACRSSIDCRAAVSRVN